MEIRFLKEKRGFLIDDYLVIGDLHLGYEKIAESRGYTIPNQRKEFVGRLKDLAKETKVKKLIILGDIKHNIPVASTSEKYEIPNFFREISKFFDEIIVIKGNHDGRIEAMVHEDNVKIVTEHIAGGVAFVHGHRYPTKEAMLCKTMVMGHVHPTFKVKDLSGIKHNYACWVIGKIKKDKLKKYKQINCEKVIITPSFNPLTSGYGGLTGPLAKAIRRKEIYLLDLTKVM